MKIGATEMQRSSNECRLDGEKIVIKCARLGTPSIGVTYKMLDHLDGILGAFELDDGTYDLFLLGPDAFRENLSATQSRGASAGKVGKVTKNVFVQRGRFTRQRAARVTQRWRCLTARLTTAPLD